MIRRFDRPTWLGLGLIFLALGLALMEDLPAWRLLEYAAALCGIAGIFGARVRSRFATAMLATILMPFVLAGAGLWLLIFKPETVQAQTACGPLPFTFVSGTVISSGQVNANFTALLNCLKLNPTLNHTATLATLKALSVSGLTANSRIARDGYLTPGDGGAAVYTYSGTACSVNSGVGDGGTQAQPNAGGGCWLVDPSTPLDTPLFGITTPPIFYVAQTGKNYGGANKCVISTDPCLTINQAVAQYYLFPWRVTNIAGVQANNFIQIQDSATYSECVVANSNQWTKQYALPTTVPQLVIAGQGSGTIIAGDGVCLYSVLANGAVMGIQQIKVTGAAKANQSPLFCDQGGNLNIYSGVTVGESNGAEQIHIEQCKVNVWASFTAEANASTHNAGTNLAGIYYGGQLILHPVTASVTFTNSPVYAGSAGLIKAVGSGSSAKINVGWSFVNGGSITVPGSYFVALNASIDNISGNAIPGGQPTLETGGQAYPSNAPTVAGVTGLGTGGSVGVAMAANSGDYGGAIVMTTGNAATAAQGTTVLTFTGSVTGRQCTFGVQDGATGWSFGSTAFLSARSGSNYTLAWQSGSAAAPNLTINTTYQIPYTCASGNGQL